MKPAKNQIVPQSCTEYPFIQNPAALCVTLSLLTSCYSFISFTVYENLFISSDASGDGALWTNNWLDGLELNKPFSNSDKSVVHPGSCSAISLTGIDGTGAGVSTMARGLRAASSLFSVMDRSSGVLPSV